MTGLKTPVGPYGCSIPNLLSAFAGCVIQFLGREPSLNGHQHGHASAAHGIAVNGQADGGELGRAANASSRMECACKQFQFPSSMRSRRSIVHD